MQYGIHWVLLIECFDYFFSYYTSLISFLSSIVANKTKCVFNEYHWVLKDIDRLRVYVSGCHCCWHLLKKREGMEQG